MLESAERSVLEMLSEAERSLLETAAERVRHAPGEILFSENEPGTGFFLILAGAVKVYKTSAGGREKILGIFGEGQPVGLAALFGCRRFPAGATALEPTQSYFFRSETFHGLLERNPALARSFLSILTFQLCRLTQSIADLTFKDATARLAAFLLSCSERRLANSSRCRLGISKNELAALLGVAPETLSRILAKLSANNIIELNGAQFRVLDRRQLQALAEGE